jgi:hypothetical protein
MTTLFPGQAPPNLPGGEECHRTTASTAVICGIAFTKPQCFTNLNDLEFFSSL